MEVLRASPRGRQSASSSPSKFALPTTSSSSSSVMAGLRSIPTAGARVELAQKRTDSTIHNEHVEASRLLPESRDSLRPYPRMGATSSATSSASSPSDGTYEYSPRSSADMLAIGHTTLPTTREPTDSEREVARLLYGIQTVSSRPGQGADRSSSSSVVTPMVRSAPPPPPASPTTASRLSEAASSLSLVPSDLDAPTGAAPAPRQHVDVRKNIYWDKSSLLSYEHWETTQFERTKWLRKSTPTLAGTLSQPIDIPRPHLSQYTTGNAASPGSKGWTPSLDTGMSRGGGSISREKAEKGVADAGLVVPHEPFNRVFDMVSSSGGVVDEAGMERIIQFFRESVVTPQARGVNTLATEAQPSSPAASPAAVAPLPVSAAVAPASPAAAISSVSAEVAAPPVSPVSTTSREAVSPTATLNDLKASILDSSTAGSITGLAGTPEEGVPPIATRVLPVAAVPAVIPAPEPAPEPVSEPAPAPAPLYDPSASLMDLLGKSASSALPRASAAAPVASTAESNLMSLLAMPVESEEDKAAKAAKEAKRKAQQETVAAKAEVARAAAEQERQAVAAVCEAELVAAKVKEEAEREERLATVKADAEKAAEEFEKVKAAEAAAAGAEDEQEQERKAKEEKETADAKVAEEAAAAKATEDAAAAKAAEETAAAAAKAAEDAAAAGSTEEAAAAAKAAEEAAASKAADDAAAAKQKSEQERKDQEEKERLEMEAAAAARTAKQDAEEAAAAAEALRLKKVKEAVRP